eukprot:351341-Chlamydomonas_euryale.AAC.3
MKSWGLRSSSRTGSRNLLGSWHMRLPGKGGVGAACERGEAGTRELPCPRRKSGREEWAPTGGFAVWVHSPTAQSIG